MKKKYREDLNGHIPQQIKQLRVAGICRKVPLVY